MKKVFFLISILFLTISASAEENRAIAILLDISRSVRPQDFQKAKQTIKQIVDKASPSDSISVYTFGEKLQKIDPSELEKVEAKADYTIVYDAIYDVIQGLEKSTADRRAILIASDGRDTKSVILLDDAITNAKSRGIAIYAVGIGDLDRKSLERITKLTGGKLFDVNVPGIVDDFNTSVSAQIPSIADIPQEVAPPQGIQPGQPSAGIQPPVKSPDVAIPQPSSSDQPRAYTPYLWIAGIVIGIGLLAVSILKSVRKRKRVCPTCGKTLQPYQAICPECSAKEQVSEPEQISDTVVLSVDGTQEIGITIESELEIPPELLERKPESDEGLTKTYVLMDTPVLIVRKGRNVGQSFALSLAFPVSIGRSRVNEIRLEDVSVSGQHCRIIPEGGKHVLYDLGSTNGTFVNEKKVNKHVLIEGDVIKIGGTQFLYKVEQLMNP